MSEPSGVPEVDAEWRRAFAEVERMVGGRIRSAQRQARWRPAWFLEVEREGELLPVHFRGDRGEADHGVYPLEHEYRVLRALEDNGIPVPHVYGFCEDPRGIVMQTVPGRANLATAVDEAEHTAVLEDFVRILARMHQLDVSEFARLGIDRPTTPVELGLGDLEHWERAYRGFKCRPEPMIEFGIRWVRRNVPSGRSDVAFIQGDAGQFLFEDGKVTSLIDMELACIGDPAADFGAMLGRDLSEPLGDLSHAVRLYGELTGKPLDPDAICYHGARFGMYTPMVVAHLIARPGTEVDYVQYLAWYLTYGRAAIELMAHLAGVELDTVELPDAGASRHAPGGDALLGFLEPPAGADEYTRYRLDVAARAAEYLRRAERWGDALEAQNLDEIGAILGRRPASWQEADADLEHFVLEAGPEHDAALIRYFHRHCLRGELLIEPVARELAGVSVQKIA